MNYRVVITANAKSNLREYYERAAKSAPETAANWLNRFHTALRTLASQPERCPLAAENSLVEEEFVSSTSANESEPTEPCLRSPMTKFEFYTFVELQWTEHQQANSKADPQNWCLQWTAAHFIHRDLRFPFLCDSRLVRNYD